MTIAFHKIWVDQCQAAEGIKDDFGAEKALGYLIGEKLLNFLDASTTRPEWEAEIPAFVAEIRRIFQPWEITTYLENVKRVGALAPRLHRRGVRDLPRGEGDRREPGHRRQGDPPPRAGQGAAARLSATGGNEPAS